MLYYIIAIYFTLALFSVNQTTGNQDINVNNVVWRSERVCGVNSLYFLLTLSGHKADYLKLQDNLLKEKLVSLEDIRKSAESHGMPVCVTVLTPEELRSLATPVIVHLDNVDISGSTQGHYVVIFETDVEGVHYLDGTTAESFHISWREFERAWSGYAVYPYESTSTNLFLVLLSLVTGATCGYFFMYRGKIHRSFNKEHKEI
ncbi:cysteine peptidase family C39 domain-containing protein [Gimesia sp.]|uniref:cysteine peptidase family C39 domain-containing protein n=1 Tax=Gimesia sp. TaxID=2024833 RepID=UPI003A94634D